MNNYIKIFALSALMAMGCDSFIEEQNKSNVTAEEFYVTEEGYSALVNANYAALKNIYGQDPWLFMAGTDIFSEGRDPEPVGLSRYSDLNAGSEGVEFLYTQCYDAIRKANAAIYYNDITEQTSNITQLLGEMRVLRANAYFLLVQTYGGVSLITDAITEPITEFDRSSADVIYDFIIAELEAALSQVSNEAYSGRVNSRAVNHLLAKVYLTRAYEDFAGAQDFADAASYAEAAINGQTLDLSFAEIWMPGNEMNAETIFSVQFSEASISQGITTLGHQQQNHHGAYLGGNEVAGDAPYKSYNLLANEFALSLFEQNDTRWEGTFMTEVFDRYYDYFEVEDHSTLNVAHFYAPSWYTTADSTAYVTANPGVVYHNYGTYDPENGDITGDYNMICIKKFDDPISTFATGDDDNRVSTRDFIIARLAETYLIAAEAYLGAGQAGTGLDRLNEVRSRAGVADATAAEFDIDYILDERARELMGEYHRWFDLKRTGKLVERASAHHMWIEEANFTGTGGELKILRPIPQVALDLNQNQDFGQNPAYN